MIDRTRISEPFEKNTAIVFEYEAMVDEINVRLLSAPFPKGDRSFGC